LCPGIDAAAQTTHILQAVSQEISRGIETFGALMVYYN
jgi:hypothetical protein